MLNNRTVHATGNVKRLLCETRGIKDLFKIYVNENSPILRPRRVSSQHLRFCGCGWTSKEREKAREREREGIQFPMHLTALKFSRNI